MECYFIQFLGKNVYYLNQNCVKYYSFYDPQMFKFENKNHV